MQTFSNCVDGYYDVSNQMIADLHHRATEKFRQQELEKSAFDSIKAFELHRKRVRDHFLKAIGELPTERTPLNVQCTGKLDRGNYIIEKLLYESLPNFFVTSLLYVPKGITEPQPTIVFVHGHADNAKAFPQYQKVCIDLAENGFVVMAIDPPGQGERFQYFENGERKIGGCTTEHTHAGLRFTLCGASIARHFIWDVIRGLDYLETRLEVDPDRIGLTGNSGGGTQSSFLMMSDSRFAAAMPCTFIMTLESYMKTGQPQDSEQIVPGCFVHGPDHDDYITAMAPKPVRVGAVNYDFFPIEGSFEAVARAKKIYALYSADDKVDIVTAPCQHEYSIELRQACVNFFKMHFRNELPNFQVSDPNILPDQSLWVTPSGQVLEHYPKSRTVFDLNLERFRTFNESERKNEDLRERVISVLGVEDNRKAEIHARIISDQVIDGYRTEKIFFIGSTDIVLTGVMIHPKEGIGVERTELVIFENGTNEIPHRKEWLIDRLNSGVRLFVFDVRGIGGVSSREFNRSGYPHAAEYKLACDAMMLGISTLGLRTFDVLRGYDYLRTRSDIDRTCYEAKREISIYGVGKSAFYAYFASVIEEGFSSAVFEDFLISYQDLVETKYYDGQRFHLDVMAWGILQRFDLPDLEICLAGREVQFINRRNAKGEIV